MRPVSLAVLAFAGLLGPITSAHADTVYNLTFTSDDGVVVGGGTLDLNTNPSAAGTSTFYEAGDPANSGQTIDSLSMSFYKKFTYNLNNESAPTSATYRNGMLSDLTYQDFPSMQDIQNGAAFYSSNGLTFQLGNALAPFPNVSGTMVATEVTPEPSSLVLLGTGLMCGVTALRRRFA